MRCLVVVTLIALVVAEPPASKDNTASETKDKRGAVSYGTTSDYSSAQIGYPSSHAALPYAGLGAASPLLLSGAGLGVLGGSYGLSGYHGLQAPISLAGLGHGYAGLGHAYAGLGQGLGHGYASLGQGLGHGLAYNPAQPLLLSQGLGLGAVGGIPAYHGLGGVSSLSLAAPVSGIKLSASESYSVPETHSSSTYLSPPSKSYGVPAQSSYSSSFQPITSTYSSPSTSYGVPSSTYSAPSTSYGPPSSSYGPPSSSYSAPSSSYSAPSSSYGAPSVSSDSYNTVSYSGSHSRDYRSNH